MVLTRSQAKKRARYAAFYRDTSTKSMQEFTGDGVVLNDLKTIEEALALDEPEKYITEDGHNILQLALRQKNSKLANKLLDKFTFDLAHRNIFKFTALDYAAYDYDLLRRLLVLGATVTEHTLYFAYITDARYRSIRFLVLLGAKPLILGRKLSTYHYFANNAPNWREVMSLDLYARGGFPRPDSWFVKNNPRHPNIEDLKKILDEGLTLNQMCQYGLESAKLKKEIRNERQRLGLS